MVHLLAVDVRGAGAEDRPDAYVATQLEAERVLRRREHLPAGGLPKKPASDVVVPLGAL